MDVTTGMPIPVSMHHDTVLKSARIISYTCKILVDSNNMHNKSKLFFSMKRFSKNVGITNKWNTQLHKKVNLVSIMFYF